MALESPIPSPDMSSTKKIARKISAPASYGGGGGPNGAATSAAVGNPTSCAAQIAAEEAALADVVAADGTEKTKVPCEFCNEPCSLEALMRHQVKKMNYIKPYFPTYLLTYSSISQVHLGPY